MNESLRRPPALLLLVPATIALVLVYPALLDLALERAGVRGVAFGIAAVAIGAFPLTRRSEWSLPAAGIHQALLAALLAAAILFNQRVFLQLIPALAQAVLFTVFWASRREPVSLIERGARLLQPHAPDFIGPYCRKVTLVWAAFFALNAVSIAGLAILAPASWWQAYTSWILIGAMTLLFAVEFVVRKSFFRYYPGGPVDRIWASLLPAENTPQGRRTIAYIREKRRELGMEPPAL
jgi:uncharacterized membrane protein